MTVRPERVATEDSKRLILISFLTWILLVGGVYAAAATDSTLRVSPETHDFGAVKRLGDQVHTSFTVRVEGSTPITIRRIWTS
jgi:hypothetical protein